MKKLFFTTLIVLMVMVACKMYKNHQSKVSAVLTVSEVLSEPVAEEKN